MRKTLLYTLISLLALCACENETYIDHSYNGTINQTTNPDAPSPEEAVDLGLSVKWAPYNIGAKQAQEYGNYYAYGEISAKESYSNDNYSAPSHKNSFGNIISTDSDVATKIWGTNWRMPSSEEISELRKCNWEETEINGVKGLKITSRTNGNSIFLPAAGIFSNDKLYEHNIKGFYRSGEKMPVDFEYFKTPDGDFYGFSVRPVLSVAGVQTNNITIPEENEAIDLGLSIKWAPFNVGAKEPYEFGNYYSFGEIEPKTNYTRDNYSAPTQLNCEGGIANSGSDVADVKWGQKWRMPSSDEFEELFARCEVVQAKYNGISGLEFTGPNGNRMFLPMAGFIDDYKTCETGVGQRYYRCTDNLSNEEDAYKGFPVRPVLDASLQQNATFPIPEPEESVDLGVSVNWAPYNIGASSETETGNYYAWGETEIKEYYCKHNYDGPDEIDAVNQISGTKYDVAHVKWGNGWRMPTAEEVAELWMNCTWKEEKRDGIDGISITSFNGNSIFLPISGYIDYTSKKSTSKGYYRFGSENPANINYFYIDSKFLGAVVRPVIDNGNNEKEEIGTENLIKVTIDNFTHTNYTKNHWDGVYTDRIEIGGDFTISINNKSKDVKEYGIHLYRNGNKFAKVKSESGVSHHFDLLKTSNGSSNAVTYEAKSDILPNNESYDENTKYIQFAACQDDFAYMYKDGVYIANLGGSYKYSTYYITQDGQEFRGDKLYPVIIEYKLEDEPYVIVDNIHENGPVEDHGHYMSLPYGWEMTTHGSLFIDTLYTVNVKCTFTNINDPSSYTVTDIGRSGTHTIYEGKLGVGTSYAFSKEDNDYDIQFIEGAIRKGNELVKFKTKPMVFKRSNGQCTLTSPDIAGWPDNFNF